MEDLAKNIVSGAVKRAVAQKKYKEEVYEPKRKTNQSRGVRVDKRIFNKGRPKKSTSTSTVVNPEGKDIIHPPVRQHPAKKLNAIEKLAGQIIGGYIRSKLDAMDLQPAIFSDLFIPNLQTKLQEKVDNDKPLNINAIVQASAKVAKRRGRPAGAKDKAPRKKKE